MFARILKTFAVFAGLVASTQACKADFTATFNDVNPSAIFPITLNGTGPQNVTAGLFNWISTPNFSSFCVEIGVPLKQGDVATFHVAPISTVPDISNGGNGAVRAALLQTLFDNNYGANVDTPAFQLAVWKIVYENLNGSNLASNNLSTGIFTVGTTLTDASYVADANTYLSNLGSDQNPGKYALVGLLSVGDVKAVSQNQIEITAVPAPAAVVLFALGLPLVALRRRMNAKV